MGNRGYRGGKTEFRSTKGKGKKGKDRGRGSFRGFLQVGLRLLRRKLRGLWEVVAIRPGMINNKGHKGDKMGL